MHGYKVSMLEAMVYEGRMGCRGNEYIDCTGEVWKSGDITGCMRDLVSAKDGSRASERFRATVLADITIMRRLVPVLDKTLLSAVLERTGNTTGNMSSVIDGIVRFKLGKKPKDVSDDELAMHLREYVEREFFTGE